MCGPFLFKQADDCNDRGVGYNDDMTNEKPQPLFDSSTWLIESDTDYIKKTIQSFSISEASNEYQLAKRFLLSYKGSEDTFNSYRREVERLCQWSWLFLKRPIKSLDRHDIENYFSFVQNPPKAWVNHKHCKRFITNEHGIRVPCEEWRPFLIRKTTKKDTGHQALSQATLRAIIAGTSTFFTYLQQENYLTQNPVALIRQKSKYIQKVQFNRVTRKLSSTQWHRLITEIERLAKAQCDYERELFIFSAFYLLGLRISELAESPGRKPVMSDFFVDSNGLWWFKTIGKGNKAREIAVPDHMLDQLKRYRRYLGLTTLPTPSEQSAIIPKRKGKGGIGIRQLRKIVQGGFDLTIEALIKEGQVEESEYMKQATVHWLRHTAISQDVQNRPREHVRDDAGHQSVQVTDKYIEIDLKARHASARAKTLLNKNLNDNL